MRKLLFKHLPRFAVALSCLLCSCSRNSSLRLHGDNRLRIGQRRVTIKPHPLTVNVQRQDGTQVQELVFDDNGANSISFRTSAPVLGLGEGADLFDRRGANYPLINGQRYRLGELARPSLDWLGIESSRLQYPPPAKPPRLHIPNFPRDCREGDQAKCATGFDCE